MNVALLLSGGRGSRIGGEIPKQYLKINDKPVIFYCLRTLMRHEMIDAIQVVCEEEYRPLILECVEEISKEINIEGLDEELFRGFSDPGENRQLSILNGLKDIKKYASDADTVLIHDAARPCVSEELITNCYGAMIGHEGVIPVLPMKDTVYLSGNGQKVSSLLDRSRVFSGQAPELFLIGKYYEANQELLPDRILDVHGSTEPAVLYGMDVVMIPGDEANFKITTRADLERFRNFFEDADK